MPTGSASDGELIDRVKAYWDLIKVNDHVSAWSYEDVSLDPRWTLQGYLNRSGPVYDDVVVKHIVNRTTDKVEVELEITFSLPILRIRKQKMTVRDTWRLIDNRWYHVLQPDSMFRPQ